MTQTMDDFFLSYTNGNYSWCRDEFWGSSKLGMRNIMLEATYRLKEEGGMRTFIKVIFLP